jgi:lysophospholipase L1-like esterase
MTIRKASAWTVRLLALMAIGGSTIAAAHAGTRANAHWVTTWAASPEARWDGDFALPLNLPFHLWDQTLRQVVRVSLGGKQVRIVLSNTYGDTPLVIGNVHIAAAADGANIVAGTDHALTFSGQTRVSIPPGASVLSDPVAWKIDASSDLAVSLYVPEPTPPATFHWDARQTAYLGAGDQAASVAFKTDTSLTTRVFLSAVMVDAVASAQAVATLGDSITDGAAASMDGNTRWPDFLARRLRPYDVAVVNAGISGARLLRNKMGENALARFGRDVLDQPGVKTVIVMLGINDISWLDTPLGLHDATPAPEQMIAGYRQLIAQAHLRGVRVVGATLTPFEGALIDTPMKHYYSADKERVRQAVNQWIRSSGEFDAVVDFDAALRDPAHPQRLLPANDSGDHLHPGDAGNKAMADAIDLSVLLGRH